MPEAGGERPAPAQIRRLSAWRAPVSRARVSAQLARELSLPIESVQIWPSVEFALREVLSALRARDLEQAGVRDLVVIGAQQDPFIDRCVHSSMSCEVADWKESDPSSFIRIEVGRALALVTAMDDRWSGRIYRAPAELKDLREPGKSWSRVPWVRVGFELPRYLDLAASTPYDVQILQVGRDGEAIVISGDRVRTESHFGELIALPIEVFQDFTAWMKSRDASIWPKDAQLIQQFESQLPSPFQAYFADPSVPRLWTRASLWSSEHHADALVAKFRAQGAREDEVWSWQACSQDDYRLEEWLLRREENGDKLRGWLQISAACLRRLMLPICWEVLRGRS